MSEEGSDISVINIRESSSTDSAMNLLEWTQHKLDSGIEVVKEVGNWLDLHFLKDNDAFSKQVEYKFRE